MRTRYEIACIKIEIIAPDKENKYTPTKEKIIPIIELPTEAGISLFVDNRPINLVAQNEAIEKIPPERTTHGRR